MADINGNKTGGRDKGTRNKETQWAINLAREQKMHPFEVLLKFANRDHVALGLPEYTYKVFGKGEDATTQEELTISPELQEKAAKDACDFIMSKIKAVEISTDDETKKALTLAYANPKHS